MLHGPSVTNNTLYHTERALRESLANESKTTASWTEELECIEHGNVDEHEDKLIYNEILYIYVRYVEPSGGLISDYMALLELQKLMEDSIKTAVDLLTRVGFTEAVEETK